MVIPPAASLRLERVGLDVDGEIEDLSHSSATTGNLALCHISLTLRDVKSHKRRPFYAVIHPNEGKEMLGRCAREMISTNTCAPRRRVDPRREAGWFPRRQNGDR